MNRKLKSGLIAAAALALILGVSGSAFAASEFKVPGAAENSFIKLGFLAQGQYLWTNNRIEDKDGEHYDSNASQNLFMRRVRIMLGGQISPNLSFFIETDSPNMGKGPGKGGTAVNLQDVILTYSFGDEFKIDGGLLLTPNSHHYLTSAAGLLAIDYSPYSIAQMGPITNSYVGRDVGLEARGYLLDKKLEYRAGVFQGNRNFDNDADYTNEPFRYMGRVVFNFFEPETGYFYTGTTLGKKQILSIGGGIDAQEEYLSYGGDLFWDQPVGSGDCFTLQVDYNWVQGYNYHRRDNGVSTWLAETQYYISAAKLSIFGQYSTLDQAQNDSMNDQDTVVAGLAYWPDGHGFNIKGGWGYTSVENGNDNYMWVVQTQVFNY